MKDLKEAWDTKELPEDIWDIPDPVITEDLLLPEDIVVDHQEEMTDIIEIEAQEAEEDSLDPDPEIEVAIEAAIEVDTEEISEMTEDMVVANPQDIEKEVSQEIEKDLMAADTDPETDQDQEKEDK